MEEDLIQLEDGTWVVLEPSDYRNNRRLSSRLAGRLSGRTGRALSGRSRRPVLNSQPPVLRAQPVQVVQAPQPMPQNNVVSIAGREWPLGEIVDLAVSVLASTASLPAAPEPTGEGATDIANQTRYTQALAQHAKRNEQVRTIGKLAVALLG